MTSSETPGSQLLANGNEGQLFAHLAANGSGPIGLYSKSNSCAADRRCPTSSGKADHCKLAGAKIEKRSFR